jgi:hypothetical protein
MKLEDCLAFCKSNGGGGIGKYSTFFIKFFIFSIIFYLIWTLIASAYFSLILKMTTAYFEFIGIDISFTPPREFLYSQGIRSSIPPYIALILASTLSWKIKRDQRNLYFPRSIFDKTVLKSLRESAILSGLIIGIPILFLFRVLLQISYVYLQLSPAPGEFFAIFVIFLSGTCRVALPFLLWLALTYRQQILPMPTRLEPESEKSMEKKKQQQKLKAKKKKKKTGAKRR